MSEPTARWRRPFMALGFVATRLVLPWSARIDVPHLPPRPESGGLGTLFVCNHRSLFDVVAAYHLFYVWQMPVRFVVHERFGRRHILRHLLPRSGAIFVSDAPGQAALGVRGAIAALRHGESVVIAPEGRLATPGELSAEGLAGFNDGVSVILRWTRAPAVLVAARGTEQVIPHGKNAPRIRFGRQRPRIVIRAMRYCWSPAITSRSALTRDLHAALTRLAVE